MRRITRRLAARARLSQIRGRRARRQKQAQADFGEADVVNSFDTSRRLGYDTADTTREWEKILEWAHTNHTDAAMKVRYHTYRRTY